MTRPTRPSSKTETVVGIVILAILAGIATGLYFQQFRYDATNIALSSATAQPNATGPTATDSTLAAHAPDGFVPMSSVEIFNRDTLSDKIDGKAELYLAAGVTGMKCQRFVDRRDAAAWIEVFVYDMAELQNAFTVFSKQRRPGVEELGELAYATPNSLHFDHGKYYVEIVAAVPTDRIRSAMREYWRKFTAAVDFGKSRLSSDMALFPSEQLRKGSVSRTDPTEFGIEGFDDVYTAVYLTDGIEVTAFLSRRHSEQEAARLAASYGKFFEQFGGKSSPAGEDIPGGTAIEILGTYKVVFAHGPFVAGVHESASKDAAHKIGLLLSKRLSEAHP